MISDAKALGIILTCATFILILAILITIVHHFFWKWSDRRKDVATHTLPSHHHHHHHHQHHHQDSTPFHNSSNRELLSTSTPEFLGKAGCVEQAKPKLIVKQRTLPSVPEKHSDFQTDKTKPVLLGISNPFFDQNVDEDNPNLFRAKTTQRIQPRSSIQFPSSWKSYSFDSARSSVASNTEEVHYMMEEFPNSQNSDQKQKFNGKIHLSLDFEASCQKLTIAILKASDLPNCEYTGTADPYVKLDILNDYGLQASYQTKIQRKTLNPIFNEKFTVWCQSIASYQIQASVYDFDRFSRHRLIGYAVFEEALIGRGGCRDVVMDLNMDHHLEKSHNLGQLLVSLKYLPTAGRLTVSIIKAVSLSGHHDNEEDEEEDDVDGGRNGGGDDEDGGGKDGDDDDDKLEDGVKGEKEGEKTDGSVAEKTCLPDPYVKVTLMCHGRQVRKRKTSTKSSTRDPVYNESINFDVPQESIDQVHVDVRVHSKRSPSSKMLGACAIGPQFLGTSRDHWTAMLQYPRKPVAKWYQLSPYVKS